MQDDLRITERKENDEWVQVKLKDIKSGDIFRLFEGDTREPVGASVMVALEDSYAVINEYDKPTWTVKVNHT